MNAKYTITTKQLEKMSLDELVELEEKIKNCKRENADKYEIETIVHSLSQANYYLDFVIKEIKKIKQKFLDTESVKTKLGQVKKYLNKNFKEFTK